MKKTNLINQIFILIKDLLYLMILKKHLLISNEFNLIIFSLVLLLQIYHYSFMIYIINLSVIQINENHIYLNFLR